MVSRTSVFLAVLGVSVLASCAGSSTESPSATSTTRAEGASAVRNGPVTYHVVYRVEDLAAGDRLVSTDDLWVRRPFDSRLERRVGGPPGEPDGAGASVTISSFGRFSNSTSTGEPLVLSVKPNVASGDLRLDVTLPDLVRTGLVADTGRTRSILGRLCSIFRTGEPLGTGALKAPTSRDHAEACVDDRGIILQEEWTASGVPLRRRSAVAVVVDEPPTETLFAQPLDTGAGIATGGAVTEIDVDATRTESSWDLDDLPGFHHLGRYEIRQPTTAPAPRGGLLPSIPSVADVWLRGPDLVVVEQGDRSLDPSPVPAFARRVDSGRLPHAVLITGAYGNVIRAEPDATHIVRVLGTLPSGELLQVARRLAPTG